VGVSVVAADAGEAGRKGEGEGEGEREREQRLHLVGAFGLVLVFGFWFGCLQFFPGERSVAGLER